MTTEKLSPALIGVFRLIGDALEGDAESFQKLLDFDRNLHIVLDAFGDNFVEAAQLFAATLD